MVAEALRIKNIRQRGV